MTFAYVEALRISLKFSSQVSSKVSHQQIKQRNLIFTPQDFRCECMTTLHVSHGRI